MLRQLTITGGACFGNAPLALDGIKKVNFFFGPNGSGKTTISRALAGHPSLTTQPTWHDGSNLKVKVYNRDFVNGILKESNRIPGVFVVGKKSVKDQRRLETIESENGLRDVANTELINAQLGHTRAANANSEANESFREAAWKVYQKFITDHPELKPAFTGQGGIGNSKQSLVDRLLALEQGTEPPVALDALIKDANAVFDTTATTCDRLPSPKPFDAKSQDGHSLLDEKIVGSDEISLSDLIAKLGNSDWVRDGREHLKHSDGRCPFCQQLAPVTLLTDLAAMYDGDYTSKQKKIKSFAEAFSNWSEGVRSLLDDCEKVSRNFLDEAKYLIAMTDLQTQVGADLALLEKKQQNLASTILLSELDAFVTDVNTPIGEANKAIKAHNDLIDNRRKERPKLVGRCWQYLAFDLLHAVRSDFVKKQAGRNRGVEVTLKKVTDAQTAISTLDDEVKKLQSTVRSTQLVIDRINALLSRSGFTSFKIVPSAELTDGYMLSRGDGIVQEDTLSEGERTFIAFLYYVNWLDEEASESDDSHRVLAVIDDPVSSLDSEVLFVVGAIVRQIIARVFTNDDHLEQVIILTHNVYFHKDISHLKQGQSDSGRSYFVIQKQPAAASRIESHNQNPITTEYRRLWDEVKRALNGEPFNVVGLENILRRILESYFRVMGGRIWVEDIEPRLEQAELPAFQALFRWANEGSHSILEEAYFTPTSISQDLYLEVFRRIFEVTDNEGHFQMMTQGKAGLPPLPSEVQ